MPEQSLPAHLKERIEKELQPDERVVWFDMPVPCFFTRKIAITFLVGIFWTAFTIFWIVGFSRQEGSWAFSIFWGSPFMLIGLSIMSIPIWSYRSAFKTVYVITNKRAVTIETGWSSSIRSFSPDMLKNIRVVEKNDGIGDIIISPLHQSIMTSSKTPTELGFIRVRNLREVESRLNSLAK